MTTTPNTPDRALSYTAEQIARYKRLHAPAHTDDELRAFFDQCERTQLDPWSRQIYTVRRSNFVNGASVERAMTQVSIDGLRLQAERSGKYAGQAGPFWCGKDGRWVDVWLADMSELMAAKVGVFTVGFSEPRFWGVARFDAYAQTKKGGGLNVMWEKLGDVMIAKCFSEDTEVLTDHGFKRFSEVGNHRVMMVENGRLLPTSERPFKQYYNSSMIEYKSDDLDFCVTPNHDMLTTFGKVSAEAMFVTSTQRGPWKIPRITERVKADAVHVKATLSGYILADGTIRNGNTWAIAVSRPDKIKALRTLALHTAEFIKPSRGDVATASSGGKITTNFDKTVFVYQFGPASFAPYLDSDRQLRRDINLSPSEARTLVDAWQAFDGHTNKRTGVRRLYCSDANRLSSFETLAVMAGYSVSARKSRKSDIGDVNYYVTINDHPETKVFRQTNARRPSLKTVPNKSDAVWCVTVPSGVIVVRRNGFSMLCGNCAEALALRKACPAELSGLYTTEEMLQADAPSKEAPMTETEILDRGGLPKTSAAAPAAPKLALVQPAPETAPAPAKAAPAAPKPAPKPAGAPETFMDLKADIESWKTVEKANAGLPMLLGMKEPARSAGMAFFKAHRIAQRWEVGKVGNAIAVRSLNIDEWTTIERAEAGLILIEAMTGEERSAAMQKLEVRCHENGWILTKAPKLAVEKVS